MILTILMSSWEIRKIRKGNKKLVSKYCKWDGHDFKIWYQEYLRFFEKLLNSPFKRYAYGGFTPVPYKEIVKSRN